MGSSCMGKARVEIQYSIVYTVYHFYLYVAVYFL